MMTGLTCKILTEKYMYQKMRIYNIRIYFIKSIELFTFDYRYQKCTTKKKKKNRINIL